MNKTPTDSPQYLRMSLAAAMTLEFRNGLFYRNACSFCVNLLLTYQKGCAANCAYCGLAKERRGQYDNKSFIRVEWPVYETSKVIERIEQSQQRTRRICISMITIPCASQDTLEIIKLIRKKVDIPISVLISPTVTKENHLLQLKRNGADRVGIAVDCANPVLFEKYRGKDVRGPHRWDTYWQTIDQAIEIFGKYRVGVHLIVGMGETEKEMLHLIQHIFDGGANTHLFSFFPEKDSQMANHVPPPLGQYRRIQLGRFLIEEEKVKIGTFSFDEWDRITSFAIPDDELSQVINSGKPFLTSGCPDGKGRMACNRPYANCAPGPQIRNYPFGPTKEDVLSIREQIWQY